MKRLNYNFNTGSFILIASLLIILTSCSIDDSDNDEPVNPINSEEQEVVDDEIENPNTEDELEEMDDEPESSDSDDPEVTDDDPENPATVNELGVINVDFMASTDPTFGDEIYVGENGIFSSPSGEFWNACESYETYLFFYEGFLDEFEKETTVDLLMSAHGLTNLLNISSNELQDSGIEDPSGRGFELQGLIADNEYDISFYIYGYDFSTLSHRTTFDFTHADGKISPEPDGANSFILPGLLNKDYFLMEKVKPYEISNGVYGFKIENIRNPLGTEGSDGAIMGFQLKGLIPYKK